MKKLKILLFTLIALVVVLIVIKTIMTSKKVVPISPDNPPVVDSSEVHNAGGDIIEYDGYTYYVNLKKAPGYHANKLCRKAVGSNQEELIANYGPNVMNPKLIIYDNKLFYNVKGNTFWINLITKQRIETFNQGVLHYINQGEVIYSYDGRLYIGKYYPATYQVYSGSLLVNGECTFVGEYKDYLYFYSTSEKGERQLFSVDTKNANVTYLTTLDSNEYPGKFLKCLLTKDSLYFILANQNDQSLYRYSFEKNEVEEIEIDLKVLDIVVYKDECYYVTSDGMVWEYNHKTNAASQSEITSKMPNLYYLLIENESVYLYQNGEQYLLVQGDSSGDLSDIEIEEIDNYVYVKYYLRDDNNTIIENKMLEIDKEKKSLMILNDTFEKGGDSNE